MTNLNCEVSNCQSNSQGFCCLQGIQVAGANASNCQGTCCSSFQNSAGGATNASCNHTGPNKTMSINCDAMDCVHNGGGICNAETIRVCGCGACTCTETECGSFQKK